MAGIGPGSKLGEDPGFIKAKAKAKAVFPSFFKSQHPCLFCTKTLYKREITESIAKRVNVDQNSRRSGSPLKNKMRGGKAFPFLSSPLQFRVLQFGGEPDLWLGSIGKKLCLCT